MTDKKKENTVDETVVKTPTEVNVSTTFKNETVVSNAKIVDTHYDNQKSYYNGESTTKGLNMDDLHNVYVQNGNSASAAYQYLTDYIKAHKDDPVALQNTVSLLLSDMSDAYDHTKQHGKVGVNQVEVLDKILSSDKGDEVAALICGTIHDFTAQALEDSGVEACILTGGDRPGGDPHATLLYKRSDGKYVFNNYGESAVIEAANIKDAAREVYKQSGNMESSGTISLQDKDKSSYQEFAFKDEAAFGHEMDKRDYNNKSPFDNSVAQRPSVDGNMTVSSVGNVSAKAQGTLAYGNSQVAKETSVGVEYKKTGESAMFKDSQSIGVKVGHKTENKNGVFTESKAIISNTTGTIGGNRYEGKVSNMKDNTYNDENRVTSIGEDVQTSVTVNDKDLTIAKPLYNKTTSVASASYTRPEGVTQEFTKEHPDEKASYVSAMARTEVGKKTTLVENDKLSLTNVTKGSVMIGGTMGVNSTVGHGASADGRMTAESGFGMTNKVGDKLTLSNTLSGGVVVDALETCDGFGLTPGVKLNASTGVNYRPADNVQIGAGVKGYSVFTKSSKDYGVQAGVGAQYRPEGSKITLFGSANVGVEKQNLSVGTIHEQTENNMTLNTTLGAQLSKGTQVYAGYTKHKDALNNTRSYNQFEVGAKITF